MVHVEDRLMGNSIDKFSFTLRAEDIDRFLLWVGERTAEVGAERQNRLRISLIVEELLLRMRDHLGEDVPVVASFDGRFHWMRRSILQIQVEGEPYNPLLTSEGELGDWSSSLSTAIGFTPQYHYDWGQNSLTLQIPCRGVSAVILIGGAIVLGLLLGLTGAAFLPDWVRMEVTRILLNPTYDMWLRMLNALSGPVVFLTVITTMINARGIVKKGGNNEQVISRYFVFSIIDVAIAYVCLFPLLPLDHMYTILDSHVAMALYDEMLQIVPSNIFDPFITANTPQLIFMALVLSYILIRLGDKMVQTKRLIREANMVGLKVAGWMGMLVPIFVGSFICLELWQGNTDVFVGLWLPLMAALVFSIAVVIVVIVHLALRMRMSPILIVRKLWLTFFIALKTGSLDAAYGEALHCCSQLLGIDRDYTKVALPQGLVLYMPISAIGTFAFTIYAASVYNLQVDHVWYIETIIMVVVLFVATPPVPGANLLAYVVLFATLGIPEGALLDAMTFDILFGIFAGAANQTLLQLELVSQANRIRLLDVEKLRKPLERSVSRGWRS